MSVDGSVDTITISDRPTRTDRNHPGAMEVTDVALEDVATMAGADDEGAVHLQRVGGRTFLVRDR